MLVVMSVMVVTLIPSGKIRLQLRQNLLDGVDDGDGVSAGLALDVENDGRRDRAAMPIRMPIQAPCLVFSTPFTTLATSFTKTGAPLRVGDNDIFILVGRADLIVGVDLIVLARPVEVALGGVDAGLGQRRAHILHVQAVGGKLQPDSPECEPRAFGRR